MTCVRSVERNDRASSMFPAMIIIIVGVNNRVW